jgi:hypothetical protein
MNQTPPSNTPASPDKPADTKGIICPKCGSQHFYVVYTRRGLGGKVVRRRECRHCQRRLTTHETPIGALPTAQSGKSTLL